MSINRKPTEPTDTPLRATAAQSGKRALEGYLPNGAARPARVLCFEEDPTARRMLEQATDGLRLTVHTTADAEEFAQALNNGEFDVAVLSLDRHEAEAVRIASDIAESERPVSVLLTVQSPSVDHGVLAMRCGAADLLAKPFHTEELRERIASAADRAQRLRQQARRLERLKRICRRLNQQRQEVNNQVDVLCGDLVNAYQQLADHVDAQHHDPFAMQIESELDVEALLRRTLEHMLTKTGPTNAAVYLPGNSGDFSLGAYINYDLQRETAETLLDHLADLVPSQFMNERTVVHLQNDQDLIDHFADDATWLNGSGVMVSSCHSPDGDCLAVIVVFRDAADEFKPDTLADLRSLRDTFARQLARVVRVHNRATPKAEWLGFDIGEEPEDDDYSADDWGMAA